MSTTTDLHTDKTDKSPSLESGVEPKRGLSSRTIAVICVGVILVVMLGIIAGVYIVSYNIKSSLTF